MRVLPLVLRLFAVLAIVTALAPLAQARSEAPASPSAPEIGAIAAGELPREAQRTLALIHAGGPFPYKRDGIRFGNYEGRLPARPRGVYREYTVPTPGGHNRGARRIIGGEGEYYYTDDHYETFRRILE